MNTAMKNLRRATLVATAIVAAGLFSSTSALAAWPEKPVRLIVPQPPGGFNDTVARLLAQKLGDTWKQPVVVENQPGAGGQIGTAAAARAAGDGYTLLIVSFAHATNPYLRKNLPYDTAKDFKPVVLIGQTPNLMVVRADSPYKSQQDLMKAARANPGAMTYGSSGAGTSPHLAMEMFKSMAKVDMVHVPYKGGAPMVTDLLGGRVDVVFDNVPNMMPFVASGKLRALSVSSSQRTDLVSGVPTTAEAGVPGFGMTAWYGLVVPAKTPNEVVAKINAEVDRILKLPEVRSVFAQQKVTPGGGTTQHFGEFISTQMKIWSKVIGDAHIELD